MTYRTRICLLFAFFVGGTVFAQDTLVPDVTARFLAYLANPDLAYVLLVIGIFGVIFEISAPGAVAPGVGGAVALLLAAIGFGNLPTNFMGIVFIVLAVVLFIVDIKTPTHGFLTLGGVISFVVGSLFLFPFWRAQSGGAVATPAVHISVFTIVIMTVLVVGFFVFVLGKGIGAMARRVSFGAESLVGRTAVTITACAPDGQVRMSGEQWTARSVGGPIAAGAAVEVVGRDGLIVLVRPAGISHQGT
jgi:membrane-bound serine protease (ClpP class)